MGFMTNGIKKDQNGSVLVGGGLKWLIAVALAVLGYVAGNFIPVRVALAQTEVATVAARLESHVVADEREMSEMDAEIKAMIEKVDERWETHRLEHHKDFETLLNRLGQIDGRLAVIEAR